MKKMIVLFFILFSSYSFAQKNKEYVQIDFSSICCGPPSEKPMINLIEEFRAAYKLKEFEIWRETGLGREGEYALYIGVDQLKCRKKKKFISNLKKFIDDFENKRNDNRDGNIYFRDELVNREEIAKKVKSPANQFSKIELYSII